MIAEGEGKEAEKMMMTMGSVSTVENDDKPEVGIDGHRFSEIDLIKSDQHLSNSGGKKKNTNTLVNGTADRKLDGPTVDFDGRENFGDLEVKFEKESVVTIDTTDKKGHRSALRAQHTYAAKKTVAQGMMDVALITANANQLRYLVEYQRHSPTFFVNVFLIVVSLLLQIAVGVSLIFKGRFDIQGKGKSPQALKINNYVVVGVFLITIINVFVAAFSVTASTIPSLNSQQPAAQVPL